MKKQLALVIVGFGLTTSMSPTYSFSQDSAPQDKREGQTTKPTQTDPNQTGTGEMGPGQM